MKAHTHIMALYVLIFGLVLMSLMQVRKFEKFILRTEAIEQKDSGTDARVDSEIGRMRILIEHIEKHISDDMSAHTKYEQVDKRHDAQLQHFREELHIALEKHAILLKRVEAIERRHNMLDELGVRKEAGELHKRHGENVDGTHKRTVK